MPPEHPSAGWLHTSGLLTPASPTGGVAVVWIDRVARVCRTYDTRGLVAHRPDRQLAAPMHSAFVECLARQAMHKAAGRASVFPNSRGLTAVADTTWTDDLQTGPHDQTMNPVARIPPERLVKRECAVASSAHSCWYEIAFWQTRPSGIKWFSEAITCAKLWVLKPPCGRLHFLSGCVLDPRVYSIAAYGEDLLCNIVCRAVLRPRPFTSRLLASSSLEEFDYRLSGSDALGWRLLV
ncbi:unnamed protein product [Protopolystoma xenopodis]|uniref:Uncharacterized protein n=1 Tax=Protopolystoma xenopodis TaxID=117903 RepID=A0A448WQ82_9PLAT|nr:unnamed protein product [Protopolystoma xenopodis]